MKLFNYIENNNLDKKQLAQKIDITYTSIYYYIKNKKTPSLKTFKKIFQTTNGAVEPNDFFPLDDWKKELLTQKGETL